MTTPSHSEFDGVDFALTVLDWLEDRDEHPQAISSTLRLLSHHRRRIFLSVLRSYGESLTPPDAAEEVAREETGRNIHEIPAERIATVYHSLYHDHLPRLVDAGLINYDQERDLVEPTIHSMH